MFRIFCEWEISKKISYLTHLIIVLTKQKPFLAAALQNWHSWQFSLRSWRYWQNGTVTVGWQEAQELWSTHTLPCAAHLGAARAQMLPSTSGTLQSSGTGRSPRVCTSPLSCWRAGWQFFIWALKLIFIISLCMAKEWAAAEAASACKPTNPYKFTSRDASLYLTWSAVLCIFISPLCKACLSARIL